MAQLPDEFHTQYMNKGQTFYEIAEIVLTNHGRQLTADDIAAQVSPDREGVQQHLRTLEADGWIDGVETAKTYTWNTQEYNPTEYHTSEAIGSVTAETLTLAKRAHRSATEFLAVVAIIGFTAGAVLAVSAVLVWSFPSDTLRRRRTRRLEAGSQLGVY